jgi:hypothetical protein
MPTNAINLTLVVTGILPHPGELIPAHTGEMFSGLHPTPRETFYAILLFKCEINPLGIFEGLFDVMRVLFPVIVPEKPSAHPKSGKEIRPEFRATI